jgi:hypothetical protein
MEVTGQLHLNHFIPGEGAAGVHCLGDCVNSGVGVCIVVALYAV